MGKLVKLICLGVGLLLMLYGIATLRGKLEHSSGRPASLSVGNDRRESRPVSQFQISHQPTILEAKPTGVREGTSSPRYREQMVGSAEDAARESAPSFPIQPAVPFPTTEGHQDHGASPRFDVPMEDARVPPPLPGETAGAPNRLAEEVASTATHLQDFRQDRWPEEPAANPTIWETRDDDSLWDISVARYGRGDYYHALFAHNRARIQRPDRLARGLLLETPAVEVLAKRFPQLCPPDLKEGPHRIADRATGEANELR
jgi:hypothetical protein